MRLAPLWVRLVPSYVLAISLAIALAACNPAIRSEVPGQARMVNLLETQLDSTFTPDRQVIVTRVEIPPNTRLERHWHPGEEFHYYLKGEVEIAIDGQSSIIGKPGMVGHVPYRKMHTAITEKEGATIIVFRVHHTGEPVRYLEK